ncbi:MAG: type 4a pilus biogenesis protein PilO [Deltaproteobacteria bacterium]|nr:type 4a pilus biogenesis protein PilO [Deltaproteobacteria bacterium]
MFDNQLKRQAQIRESIMVGIMMVLMCYATYAFFYAPKKKMAQDLKAQIAEITEKKSGIEKLNKALLEKYEEQKKEMKKQAMMVETLDPRIKMIKDQKDYGYGSINQILSHITQEDFKLKVSINSLKYDLPISQKGYKATFFYIMATGRFVDVMEFVENIEDIPALISLDNISINTNKSDSNRVNVDLKGTFYQLGS